MSLIRFRTTKDDRLRPGLLSNGKVYDLSARYSSLAEFLRHFPGGWSDDAIDLSGLRSLETTEVEIGPPVDEGANVYLVGANYRKHAEEAGLDVPSIPVIFSKPTTALVGPGQPISLPRISTQMDYEGELAVVMGREARSVGKRDAPAYVAGLTIVNDVTARDLQWVQLGKHRIVDWFSSKCLDQSTPVGPCIVSARGKDPHALHLTTRLNGELMQDSDTSLMVFSVWDLVEFISARVTLRPGDVISTGTPYGVGGFRKIFLKDGDVLQVEIEGIGMLKNGVASANAAA